MSASAAITAHTDGSKRTKPPTRTPGKAQIVATVIGSLLIIAVLALGFLLWSRLGEDQGADTYPLIWFIFASAFLGSVVNTPFSKDIKTIPPPSNANSYVYYPAYLLCFFVWKGLVAMIFATLLHVLFISGLLSGEMFPTYVAASANGNGAYVDMTGFLTKVDPATYTDVAKLMVWSFVAGYSETFVPNLIAKISSAASAAT